MGYGVYGKVGKVKRATRERVGGRMRGGGRDESGSKMGGEGEGDV